MALKKKLFIEIGLIFLCVSLAIAVINHLFVYGSWRYKMTVIVETPEGLKTGEAIREVTNSASSVWLAYTGAKNPADVVGEAVVVDLGDRGLLYALLRGYKYGTSYAEKILYEAFPSGKGDTSAAGIRFYRNLGYKKAVLEFEQYPVLVTFLDPKDPNSMAPALELAQSNTFPKEYRLKTDNFEEFFGAGVRLKQITIEMTDDSIRWHIDQYLVSLGKDVRHFQWTKRVPYGAPRYITRSDFVWKGY